MKVLYPKSETEFVLVELDHIEIYVKDGKYLITVPGLDGIPQTYEMQAEFAGAHDFAGCVASSSFINLTDPTVWKLLDDSAEKQKGLDALWKALAELHQNEADADAILDCIDSFFCEQKAKSPTYVQRAQKFVTEDLPSRMAHTQAEVKDFVDYIRDYFKK